MNIVTTSTDMFSTGQVTRVKRLSLEWAAVLTRHNTEVAADSDRRVSYATHDAMRFGPRTYTREQAAIIGDAVQHRSELTDVPFPLED
jgi:septal ring-binding cell division protein DamX